ncbi:hypothetical protein JCM6882_007573 [Rhodosporidiobolus microsporus]
MSNSLNSGSDKEKAVDVHHDYASKEAAPVDDVYFTPQEEKKLIRKIDFKLIPFLSLLYLLSFLDRVNIGQARLAGLEADLGMSGNDYQIASAIFFVGYVITEVPSNILLKKLRPSRVIPAIMIVWGICATLMGIVHNYEGLLAARFFLGLSESALFPGLCYYLVSFYKRDESQLRIAVFFSSATLAGAFGGLLAYGLSQMDGIGGKAGWAWIFIIEGLITIVVGCIAPFLIHDFPEQAKFLTERERAFVVRRLKEDVGSAGEFRKVHVINAFKDWKTYVYSLSLFTPTIIAALGSWSRTESQLLATPPYAAAFIVTLASAFLSDRFKIRAPTIVFFMLVTCVGFAIFLAIDPIAQPAVAYFAIFLCVCGVAPCVAANITWCGNNIAPVLKRGTAMGMMFTTGNSGGIISSFIYRTQDSPHYRVGHGVGLGCAALAAFLSAFMHFYLKAENARRDKKYGTLEEILHNPHTGEMDPSLADTPEVRRRVGIDHLTEDQIEELGDKSPLFRYFP